VKPHRRPRGPGRGGSRRARHRRIWSRQRRREHNQAWPGQRQVRQQRRRQGQRQRPRQGQRQHSATGAGRATRTPPILVPLPAAGRPIPDDGRRAAGGGSRVTGNRVGVVALPAAILVLVPPSAAPAPTR